MTTLLLIRHGDNDYLQKNIMPGCMPGVHLNEHGHSQAETICTDLRMLPIKAIYTSPLERAVETANPLASALGLRLNIIQDLRDTDVGEWVGKSWKSLRTKKVWEIIQKTPSQFRFPGGESFQEVQNRVTTCLQQIAASHPGADKVAIFMHADPIKLFIAGILRMPLDAFQLLVVHTGSVSIVNQTNDGARIVALNLIPPFSIPELP